MWVTLCANWQGFKLTMTTKTLIGWFCIGKQHVLAYIPNYLIVSLHFFLQCYLFVTRTPYHQKSCDLEWWVACCEDFVVKSGVYAVGNQTCTPLLAVFKLRCSRKLRSLHLGANLRNCQLRRPYSIHVLKVTPFGASVEPLWLFCKRVDKI